MSSPREIAATAVRLNDAAAEFAAGNYQMSAARKREQLRDLFDLYGLAMAHSLMEIGRITDTVVLNDADVKAQMRKIIGILNQNGKPSSGEGGLA